MLAKDVCARESLSHLATVDEAATSAETSPERTSSQNLTSNSPAYRTDNPLRSLPLEIRESLTFDCYETGFSSPAQDYFEAMLSNPGGSRMLQDISQRIFFYATQRNRRQVAYNLLVALSQLPYAQLGEWAPLLAVAATRSKHLDVAELGIRCFENWDNREAGEFLNGCRFEESWLQDYATDVFEHISGISEEEEGARVLFEKDFTWQVAWRKLNSERNLSGRARGHSSIGTQDEREQTFGLAS